MDFKLLKNEVLDEIIEYSQEMIEKAVKQSEEEFGKEEKDFSTNEKLLTMIRANINISAEITIRIIEKYHAQR